MRKSQENILAKAEKYNFTESQMSILKREDLSIKELQLILDYFWEHREYTQKDELVEEVYKTHTYLNNHRDNIKNSHDYYNLLNSLLLTPNVNAVSKKRRIYRMYLFLQKHLVNNDDFVFDGSVTHTSCFCMYRNLVYRNFPVYHTKLLLRYMLRHGDDWSYYYFFQWKYPEFEDDFLYNGKDSIFYYIAMELDIADAFQPNENVVKQLYNPHEHHFCFTKDEFFTYFIKKQMIDGSVVYVENNDYLQQQKLLKHPVIEKIADFCKSHGLTPSDDNETVFTQWNMYQLEDPGQQSRINECYNILGKGFATDIDAFYFSINISANCFCTITYKEYKSIYVGAQNVNNWTGKGVRSEIKLLITPDGKIYRNIGSSLKKKNIPLSMRNFTYLYKKQNVCGDFMKFLCAHHANNNVFYKDILHDFLETNNTIPITFNEIGEYYNRTDMFHKKYKKSQDIPIKWNKYNVNLSYLIIKAYTCVTPGKSREILLQQKNIRLVEEGDYQCRFNYKPYEFLTRILYQNINNSIKRTQTAKIASLKMKYQQELQEELGTTVLSDEYEQWIEEKVQEELGCTNLLNTIEDYIQMCLQSKIKVRLDIYSIEQLNNLHNRIAHNPTNYRKVTEAVKVPKKSVFLPLREYLPEEFEWITTRKRLILETELQHHCVWSYAPKISDDKCAIYSFVDTRAEYTKDGVARRYTIEFNQNRNGTYYVNQVQGKYDSVNAGDMKDYIQSLLNQYQNQNTPITK